MTKSIRSRIEALEQRDEVWVVVRRCNQCGQLVYWQDIAGRYDEPDTCATHRLAPPPSPRDIVIRGPDAR